MNIDIFQYELFIRSFFWYSFCLLSIVYLFSGATPMFYFTFFHRFLAFTLALLIALPVEVFGEAGGGSAVSSSESSSQSYRGDGSAGREAVKAGAVTRESVVQDGLVKGAEPAVAMSRVGEESVGRSGEFVYNVPLASPSSSFWLSLAYSSHAGNSIVGMGFRLNGLATTVIERVNTGKGITYWSEDVFGVSSVWDVPPGPSSWFVRD